MVHSHFFLVVFTVTYDYPYCSALHFSYLASLSVEKILFTTALLFVLIKAAVFGPILTRAVACSFAGETLFIMLPPLILSFSDNKGVSFQYKDAQTKFSDSNYHYLQRFSFGLSRHSDFPVSNLYVWKNRKRNRDMK